MISYTFYSREARAKVLHETKKGKSGAKEENEADAGFFLENPVSVDLGKS